MSIHNYLRPLWSNGPRVVHDAPPDIRTAFELLFRGKPRRQTESIVQLHRVRPLDVTVAWIEVEVEIPVEGTGLSYRRARYLHAFAIDGKTTPDELTPGRALALFEEVYGEDLVAGVHDAQRELIGLEHPARSARAKALFVGDRNRPAPVRDPRVARGAETQPVEREGPPAASAGGEIGQVGGETLASRPDPSLFGGRSGASSERAPAIAGEPSVTSASGVLSDADLLPPMSVEQQTATPRRRTPVEAFDRAFAARAGQGVEPRTDEPIAAADPHVAEGADAETAEVAPPEPTESASLSALLRARLVQRPVAQGSDERPAPEGKRAAAVGTVRSG